MTITLTREEAQQVLDALEAEHSAIYGTSQTVKAIELLRARLAQPEPELVADKYLMEVECTKCGAKQDGVLTVTAPPQRNWQGLTEEELNVALWESGTDGLTGSREDAARAIEAKLKEKNS
jgi:hypothetical protein